MRGRFVMVAWCEVIGRRTALPARLRRGAIADGMPPVAKTLSPTATICHDLPRTVSVSSHSRRSTSRRNNDPSGGGDLKSLAGLMLGHTGRPLRSEIGSVMSDLLLEKEAQDLWSPVTVCHIEAGGSQRWGGTRGSFLPPVSWNTLFANSITAANSTGERSFSSVPPAPQRGGRRSGRVFTTVRTSSGDSSANVADRQATCSDNRRQLLDLRMPVGRGVLQSGKEPVFPDDPSERNCDERLMTRIRQAAVRAIDVRRLIRWGFPGRKASETTTENDKIQTGNSLASLSGDIPADCMRDCTRAVR